MIVLRSTSKEKSGFIDYLNDCGYEFSVSTTTNSCIIIYSDMYHKYKIVFSDGVYMSKKEMIVQRQLKKEIEKNTKGQEIKFSSAKKIHFFEFDSSLKYMVETSGDCVDIENVMEMDITKAYYQMAFNLGYISEKFFNKCLDLPKIIRLRLLGSIATRKIIEDFEGDQLISVKTKTNEKMRNIWFNICLKLDEIIIECADAIRDYFLFYWVDGIYFKKDEKINDDFLQPSVQIIKHIFESHNLEYTSKNIDELIIINKNNNISLQLYINNKLKSQFCVPKQKVRQVYIEDEHGFKEKILEQFV